MKSANKLVRDNIPEIIKMGEGECKMHIADDAEYWQRLVDKIKEEAEEIITDGTPKDDIADILEVLEAICEFKKYDWQEILTIKKEKAEKRGGFKKRIILDE